MIPFFVGMVVGGVVVAFKDDLKMLFTLLVSKLWGKIVGH